MSVRCIPRGWLLRESPVGDVIFLVVGLGLFAVMGGYIAALRGL